MDAEEVGRKVREDCKFLIDNVLVLGMLVYGSVAKGESDERSDIDICVVAPLVDDKIRFSRLILANVKDVRYDVRVFELMPIYLKMEVVEHGEVVYARDIYELYEYFYTFRKLWEDQKGRQTLSEEEALELFTSPK
jgi:predicted nucleotidyltransferase